MQPQNDFSDQYKIDMVPRPNESRRAFIKRASRAARKERLLNHLNSFENDSSRSSVRSLAMSEAASSVIKLNHSELEDDN